MNCGSCTSFVVIGVGIGAALGTATHHMAGWVAAGALISAGLALLLPRPCAINTQPGETAGSTQAKS
jgi:hypothetical protein